MTKHDPLVKPTLLMTSPMDVMLAAKLAPLSQSDWIAKMSDMGCETLRFVTARVGRNLLTQNALLHAKTAAEVQHIHADYVQKAMDDYTAEAAKLLELSKEIAVQNGIDSTLLD